jgi:tetratricopeptide (TPR) repeat protein
LGVALKPWRRADVLYLASCYHCATDPEAALSCASELAGLGRSLGDDRLVALGLYRATFTQAFAQPDEGRRSSEEALRLAEATGQHNIAGASLTLGAWACVSLGRPQEAFARAEKALSIAQQFDLLWLEGWLRQVLCVAALSTGRLERSLEEARIGLRLSSGIPGLFAYFGEAGCGSAFMHLGDPRASAAIARARCEAEALGHETHAAEYECLQGYLLLSIGHDDEAYHVLEAGTTRLEALGRARTCAANPRRLGRGRSAGRGPDVGTTTSGHSLRPGAGQGRA